MSKTTAISAIALSLALTAGGVGFETTFGLGTAHAADAAKKQVSIKLGKPLKEAQELIKDKKYKDALAKLQEAEAMSGKTPYESFVIAELFGGVYTYLQDYANAAKAMESAMTFGQAPESETPRRLKTIAQLYFQANNFAKFNDVANRYMKDVGPDAEMQVLMAQAAYTQRNYKQTAELTRAAIKTAEAKGTPAKEEWLKLIRFAEHEQGNAAGEQAALEMLVQRFPGTAYWNDLLTMAQKNIKGSTKVQLDIYRLMYSTGVLTKAEDYSAMAELALQANLPSEAKKVIETGMQKKVLGEGPQKERHARLLNMAKSQADEATKALPASDADAKAAATGDPDLKLGETYWVTGQPDKAIEAIQRGIKKGVKDKDEAQLRLGAILVNQGKRSQAAEAFKSITPNSPWSQLARLWTIYGVSKQT